MVGEAVGIELRRNRGGADFVFLPLVEHPFEATAVAELVVPRGGGDAVERGRGVDLDEAASLVGLQLWFIVE